MKLEKAIEILTTYMKGSNEAEPVDFDDALMLGVEALKRIRDGRTKSYDYFGHLLPGETK